jgi:hypothetical protein
MHFKSPCGGFRGLQTRNPQLAPKLRTNSQISFIICNNIAKIITFALLDEYKNKLGRIRNSHIIGLCHTLYCATAGAYKSAFVWYKYHSQYIF